MTSIDFVCHEDLWRMSRVNRSSQIRVEIHSDLRRDVFEIMYVVLCLSQLWMCTITVLVLIND
jgi:hypothetical protein